MRKSTQPRKFKTFKFTTQQVEAAELFLKGYDPKQIGKELGINPKDVPRTINKFETILPELRRTVNKFWGWEKIAIASDKQNILQARQKQKELLRQGYYSRRVPWGFTKVDGVLHPIPEKLKFVNDVSEGILNLKSRRQLGRDLSLPQHIIRKIHSDRIYVGDISTGDDIILGKHQTETLKIVDKDKWERAYLVKPPRNPPRFGLIYKLDGFGKRKCVLDPEKRKAIFRVHKLWQQGKNKLEIAKDLKMNDTQVWRILTKPDYKKIVGNKMWAKSQKIRRKPGEAMAEKNRKCGVNSRNRILKNLPGTFGELVQKTGLSETSIRTHLVWLQKQNWVDKELVVKRGFVKIYKWYIKPDFLQPLSLGLA